MRYLSLLLGWVLYSESLLSQSNALIFPDKSNVCFVGNSITHSGEFLHYIRAFYATRFIVRTKQHCAGIGIWSTGSWPVIHKRRGRLKSNFEAVFLFSVFKGDLCTTGLYKKVFCVKVLVLFLW